MKGITYFQGNSIDCKNLQTIDASVYNILFQKYFPTKHKLYVDEEISVFFNPYGIPKKLNILQCNPNKIIVEKYVKQINQGYNRDALRWNDITNLDVNEIYNVYANDVVCRRLIYDNEQHMKTYSKKVQSFMNPVDRWEPDDLEKLGSTNSAAKSQLNTKIRSEPPN